MDVHPFGKRIYIKPEEEKTLIQSDSAKNTVRGVVIAVGPDCVDVHVGSILLFTSWGVDEVNINGEKHYFLLETDEFILAELSVQETRVAPPVPDNSVSTGGISGEMPAMSPEEILSSGQDGTSEQLPVSELSFEAGTPTPPPEV